jgi:hypothetical protein
MSRGRDGGYCRPLTDDECAALRTYIRTGKPMHVPDPREGKCEVQHIAGRAVLCPKSDILRNMRC